MIKLINIGENSYKLVFDEFDEEIEIDSLLKIDYSNLIGEIVTFPVIVNKLGWLLADIEKEVSEKKLNLEVFEAKLKEKVRNLLSAANGGKKPTVEELNNAVLTDKGFQAMSRALFETQKNRDYINSVYWSAKDKSTKLDKLSLSIQPGDINDSQLEGKVNNIIIKKSKNLIG